MLGTRHPYRREEQETIESASRAARTGAASLAANAQPHGIDHEPFDLVHNFAGQVLVFEAGHPTRETFKRWGVIMLSHLLPRLTGPRRVLLKS